MPTKKQKNKKKPLKKKRVPQDVVNVAQKKGNQVRKTTQRVPMAMPPNQTQKIVMRCQLVPEALKESFI
jgi:adenosylmethionine-8-amino-7-oxononanoate aminotransferase